MFYKNVDIKSSKKNYSSLRASVAVEFMIESKGEKGLDSILKKYSVRTSALNKSVFLDKKVSELLLANPESKPDYIMIYKLKPNDDKFTVDFFRNLFSGLVPKLQGMKVKSLQINLPSYATVKSVFTDREYFYQSAVEGLLLGNYKFDTYKSEKDESAKLSVNVLPAENVSISKVIKNAESLVGSVMFARDLVNEPAITLTPQEFAKRTRSDLSRYGVKVSTINKTELEKRGMNAVLAVGGGSDNPPLMMVLEYKPKARVNKKIALVGKGVTYDSGGLSIKPTDGMLEMKADMAGGAAVVGVIKAAAMLRLPVHLIGVIPAVENMVSGRSYKPGDVVKSYSGKTIEVKDTDAEGRIVLADALHYASKQKPDEIIDFATLTGAVVVALGLPTAGIFTKNDRIADALLTSGRKVNEPVWRLPFDDHYNTLLESDIADVSNLGPRWGGAITAGKFLEHFVDKSIPYCHIDLAGPALKHKFTNYTEKFDTGFGVRLIVDYLECLD